MRRYTQTVWNRRRFLGSAAAVAAGGLLPARRARAFGDFPQDQLSVALPGSLRAKNVLEVFLYGGLSPWETFYFVEDYGAPGSSFPGTWWHTFTDGPGSHDDALAACALDDTGPLGAYFADDADGVPVSLGPYLRPLRARPDVTARLRVLVTRHTLEPHEAAIPFSLSGKRLGAPSLAGLGAHIQRHFQHLEPGRRVPFSYVFTTGGISSDNVQAALATGLHPGSARPLGINVADTDRLTALLARPGVISPETHDALLDVYRDTLRGRLTPPTQNAPVRARALDAYDSAVAAVRGAPELLGQFPPSLLSPSPDQVCGDGADRNAPAMSIALAARLLNDAVAPARYICVIDTGLIEAAGGGGYDTHDAHAHDTARNLLNLQTALLDHIRAPGDDDPKKLDLDDTLVILNTEFGRTPWAQGGGLGRNHHPYGYTTALLGGPVTPGVVGAIAEDGAATSWTLPSESRIAALLALGIFPFSPEAFGLSDVLEANSEPGAIAELTGRLLGVEI